MRQGREKKEKEKEYISEILIWGEKGNSKRILLFSKAVLSQTLAYETGKGGGGSSLLLLSIKAPDLHVCY